MTTVATHRPGSLVMRLFANNRGTATIEFAIVGPLMLILVLATVELAIYMVADASVQIAAQAASRTGLTTTAPSSGTRATQASATIMNILGGWQNIGGTVTIATLDYGTYGNAASGTSQSGMGALGDVVSYNITLTLPGIFGVQTLTFQRNFLVQNEK